MLELRSWLQSSQDPTQVANTVKGAIVAASSVIIFVAAQIFHVQLTPDTVLAAGTYAGMIVGAIWGLYGLLMKGVVRLGSVRR